MERDSEKRPSQGDPAELPPPLDKVRSVDSPVDRVLQPGPLPKPFSSILTSRCLACSRRFLHPGRPFTLVAQRQKGT